jgi:hypothetical protein
MLKRRVSATLLTGGLLWALLALLPVAAGGGGASEASSDPILSVDALPDASNTATSVGPIDTCREVSAGETFDSDVVIEDVVTVSGIEAHVMYDPAVLKVTNADYDFLLATAGAVLDLGDTFPDTDGDFEIGAVTFPLGAATGSGVLVRMTFEAVGSGVSALDLQGVKLSDGSGAPIAPFDASGVYQGPVNDASVAVGTSCGDSDLDGYADDVEAAIGTNPAEACGAYDLSHPNPNADTKPSLNWPADFSKATGTLDSYNRINVLDISSFLAPVRYLGTNVGDNPGDGRWDLVPGPGIFGTDINVNDLTSLLAGPSGYPPMFGGAKALGGPACTP